MLQALRSFPKDVLPASATVDCLHFIACNKPAVRVRVQQAIGLTKLAAWCEQYSFAFQVDDEGYVCIAHDIHLASIILSVDGSLDPHESKLGNLLGYPACCCNFVSVIGEANIDTLAAEVATWSFVGRFRLINPTGYLDGKSLICHLPCSTQCLASLQIAEQAFSFIKTNLYEPVLSPWLFWLTTSLD